MDAIGFGSRDGFHSITTVLRGRLGHVFIYGLGGQIRLNLVDQFTIIF